MEEYIAPNRKRIPYGMMNFAVIRRDDCYYVDKTRFIPIIEDADKFFFFIRPRRFGKSLTVSMLCSVIFISGNIPRVTATATWCSISIFPELSVNCTTTAKGWMRIAKPCSTTFAISMPTIFLRVLRKNWMQKKEP